MGIGGVLRQLAAFLEECERAEAVESVDLAGCDEAAGERISAEVELALSWPPADTMALRATSLNADGTLRVGLETPEAVVPVADHGVDVEPTEATVSDGEVRVVLSASVERDGSPASSDDRSTEATDPFGRPDTGETSPPESQEHSLAGSGSRDVPPFKNPDLLASVYDSCDTFAEMAETLEMDVTAETVRRYMIDYDIHEPNSYDTAARPEEAADRDEEPVVLSDGIGLPETVTVDTLIETVKRSNTIYEVKRDVGVDREDALEMLRELNLLDLVVGRLATEAERDISRDDIVERLREASATRPARSA